LAWRVVQGYSLDADVVKGLRDLSSATDIPASRLANRALADFLKQQGEGRAGK
jgi:predicted transcriptional regulator